MTLLPGPLQKWKSNPMYWCDYCKVWMQDNPSSKATHERGVKHKENVARSKIRVVHHYFCPHPYERAPDNGDTIALSWPLTCVPPAELRNMRQKADSDKKEAALAEATMSSIEAAAKRQYEKDLAAAQAVAKSHGDWVRLIELLVHDWD